MNLTICDVCYRKEKKLTASTRRISIRKKSHLNIDVCDTCRLKVPKPIREYVRFTMGLMGFQNISERDIDLQLA